jgi:DNA-binding GntR family transcriptional regulator
MSRTTRANGHTNGEKSRVDLLVEAIRADVITGALAPGQRIDQDAWAERMNVSRTPVRLALERLESEGFVKLLPRRGALITELTTEYIEDVLSTRLVLESALGRAGADNLDEEGLAALHVILEQIEAIALPEQHAELSDPTHRFHVRLYEAARTPIMERFALQVTDHTHVFLNRIWYANRRIAQVTKLYFAALFAACEARDLDGVERVIRDHRIDLAGVILQDRVRTDDLHALRAVLTDSEVARLRAIVDSGQDPSGPTVDHHERKPPRTRPRR